jgi:hypothetical protein
MDGNNATRWASAQGSGVPNRWIAFDLGSTETIGSVRMRQNAAPGGADAATQYNIQTSPDGSTWTTLDTHNATLQDETFLLSAATASRYWRFYATTGGGVSGWSIQELQLFDQGTAGTPDNLAIGTNGQSLQVATTGLPAWQDTLKPLSQATVGTSQATVAHGLTYTPTVVLLLPTSAGQIWRSAASDSTNIYLTADAAARTCIPYVR